MLGNLGEMAKLLSRVKEIQRGMKAFREELPRMEFSATSSDGAVTVTVSGDLVVKRMEFSAGADPFVVKASVIEAVNSAAMLAKESLRAKMKELSGGMDLDLPGLM